VGQKYHLWQEVDFKGSLKPRFSHEKRTWFRYGFWDGYLLAWGCL